MSGARSVLPAPALAALLFAAPVLVGCGGGASGGGVTGQPYYVASFTPGTGSPAEQKYVLTSESGPTSSPSGTTPAPAPTAVVTPASDTTGLPSPTIAWVNGGQFLAVITYGSGSCPDGPQSIRVIADQVVEVRMGQVFPGSGACTADLRPYVTVVTLLRGVTPAKPLTARFEGSEATLPAASR